MLHRMTSQAFLSIPLWTGLVRNCQCLGKTSSHIFSMTAWVYSTSVWQRPSDLARIFVPCLNSLFADKAKLLLMASFCTLRLHREFLKFSPALAQSCSVQNCYVDSQLPQPRLVYLPLLFLKIDPPTNSARLSSFSPRLRLLKLERAVFCWLNERFCVQRVVLGRHFASTCCPLPCVSCEHIAHGRGLWLSVTRLTSNLKINHLLCI